MSLVINNNMMAANTARVLGNTYADLAKSTERLSSGLRINSAADDAAGLAIRELMRADIATMQQGIRNAADGISLLQTAEGAMGVIDEKLVRMKELAEQAATGTYTTVQREIINSEYQAMAAEIDRIANSTEFNGVKLLDGSISSIHQGQGLKIHFGTGNSAAEDYYFIQIGDVRATTESGLQVGGDAKNDIWGTVGTHDGPNTTGCCGGGIPTLDEPVPGWQSGEVFAYSYNWDWNRSYETDPVGTESELLTQGRYMAGSYQVGSGASLQDLITSVNKGTQARVRIDIEDGLALGNLTCAAASAVAGIAYGTNVQSAAQRFCFGDEVYFYGSATLGTETNQEEGYKHFTNLASAATSAIGAGALPGNTSASSVDVVSALAFAINNNVDSEFWAYVDDTNYNSGFSSLYVFRKEGGATDIAACDEQLGNIRSSAGYYDQAVWYNDEEEYAGSAGTTFNNGGKDWGTMAAIPTGYGSWGVQMEGRDVGDLRDLWILNVGSGANFDINTSQVSGMTGIGFGRTVGDPDVSYDGDAVENMLGLDRHAFVQIQDAEDGPWDGAHVRTQSHAQEALDAIQAAIEEKDKIRASLGAYQNRLENTITNMEIYAENLQASESRISDVDMATEMTTFVKNQVLTQAAVSMLSQANSLPQMALSLLNG